MDLLVRNEYFIFELSKHTAKNNKPYLRMTLTDEKRAMTNAIMFDVSTLKFEPKKGDKVSVVAEMQSYNSQTQLKISEMSFISAGDGAAFLPKSKQEPSKMLDELKHLVEKYVTDKYLLALLGNFFDDKQVFDRFMSLPAAKSVHHAYMHGLLEHTLHVAKNVARVSANYPDVNASIAVTGALLHDIGKTIELSMDNGFEYTDDGRLLGHVVMGYGLVNRYMGEIENFPIELKQQLGHIMLSHHGVREFGSPELPKTPEAMLIHQLDDLDAKLGCFYGVLEKENVADGSWSSYQRSLDREIYKAKKLTNNE
ncbi:HD domain-containing protein [Deferribacterales bacterium RsTz2092]|nr:HD family phosphohydrolase [Deferribacterales bacterium]